jgi:hypothetical protein
LLGFNKKGKAKDMTDKLEISPYCWIEDYGFGNISLCYIEHATDHWCSNSETGVDLDKEDAEKIIAWLQLKFNFKPNASLKLAGKEGGNHGND